MIFGGLEPAKPQIREYVKFGDCDSGICRGPSSGVTREDIHEPTKKQRLTRESAGDPVRESRMKIFTNRQRSKVKVVVPKSPGFECELVADL
jgi:hypothetical protein